MRTCRCVKQAGWSVTVTMATASRRNSTPMLVRSEFISERCETCNSKVVFAHVALVVACGRGLFLVLMTSFHVKQNKTKKNKRVKHKEKRMPSYLAGRRTSVCVPAPGCAGWAEK